MLTEWSLKTTAYWRCAGTQFDPRLIEAFVRAMRQLPNPIIEIASLLSRTS